MPIRRRAKKTNLKKLIQSVVSKNIETKQIDQSFNGVSVPDTGITYSLSAVATGDTQNSRQGNAITVTGVYGNIILQASDATNIIRCIMYISHDTDDLISVSHYGLVDQDKYTVLMDKYITVGTAGTGVRHFTLKKSFKRGNRKGVNARFSGTGSTDYARNAIRLYFVSDSAAASHPFLDGQLRTYFKDA